MDVSITSYEADAAWNTRTRIAYRVLAIYTGLRQGEMFALRWSDLDLDGGKLTVNGTLKLTKGKTYVDAPKTRRGRWRVSLPAASIVALRRHRPAEADASAWIFTDADGGPLRRANVTGRSFRPILKKAGLPVFKFHERDTYTPRYSLRCPVFILMSFRSASVTPRST